MRQHPTHLTHRRQDTILNIGESSVRGYTHLVSISTNPSQITHRTFSTRTPIINLRLDKLTSSGKREKFIIIFSHLSKITLQGVLETIEQKSEVGARKKKKMVAIGDLKLMSRTM